MPANSTIRPFSNVPSYQLNRNTLEAELLRLNKESDRFSVVTGVKHLDVEINPDGPHQVHYRAGDGTQSVAASWLGKRGLRLLEVGSRERAREEVAVALQVAVRPYVAGAILVGAGEPPETLDPAHRRHGR